jgi:hypothetical protein
MNRHPDLPQVIRALHPPRRLPRRLNRRQQHGNQNADDRDDDEQFDQGKPAIAAPTGAPSPTARKRITVTETHDTILRGKY